MRLFIAEKPDLAKAIAEAIGNGIKQDGFIKCDNDHITWCFGHMLALANPEAYNPKYKFWSLDDLPLNLTPTKHIPIPNSKKQLTVIKKLLKEADEIVHAGDPDDEGQLLVDEILVFYGNKKPVKRVLINDNNPKLVKKALEDLKPNEHFYGLYQSALARSIADQAYGFNLSRAYTIQAKQNGHTGSLIVGRVQTPILGLVVNRDRQHEAHTSNIYYAPSAVFAFSNGTITANYVPPLVENKERKETLLPFSLLELQTEVSNKLGLNPEDTLSITQSLKGKHQLITYNRSDCSYLNEEQHESAPLVLDAIARTNPKLEDLVKTTDKAIKSRAFNSENVSAHHAIIPTETVADLQSLSVNEQKVYNIIAKRYIDQFTPPSIEFETDEEGRLTSKDEVQLIAEACLNSEAILTGLSEEEKEESPPLPFSLLELQAEASKKYGLKPTITLDITQNLREKHRLITYNRSDCSYLNEEQHESAPLVLDAIARTNPKLEDLVKTTDKAIKSRAFNSENVSAHHAIIPTETVVDLQSLSVNEQNIYNLIAERYINQFYPKFKYLEINYEITCSGNLFKKSYRKIIENGFKKDAKESNPPPPVNENNNGLCTEFKLDAHMTKPPKRYTHASLLKDLTKISRYIKNPEIKKILISKDKDKKGENGGIGTPATRASIIESLITRGFIQEEGKTLVSSQLGRSFYDLLPIEATTPDMTALWHTQQQQIIAGEITINEFLQNIDSYIAQEVSNIKNNIKTLVIEIPEDEKCRKDGKRLIKRPGKKKNTFWWGCSGYPECKETHNDLNGKPEFK